MEVVLVDGFGIELSVKAMLLYLKKAGIMGWLYAWPETESDGVERDCERIDEEFDFGWGDPHYHVVDVDLGKFAPLADVTSHEMREPIKPFSRTDKILIEVLRELGQDAPGYCQLYIANIPDGIEWHIKTDSDDFREYAVEGPYRYPQHWYGDPVG